jgi:hypothetical protein
LLFLLAVAIVVWPNLNVFRNRVIVQGPVVATPDDSITDPKSVLEVEEIALKNEEQAEAPATDGTLALDAQSKDLLSIVGDNTMRMAKREMPAYWDLLKRSHTASYDQIHAISKSNFKFKDFYSQPAKNRGALANLDLIVRRVIKYEAEPDNAAGLEHLYEVWGSTEQSGSWLYVVVTGQLPEGFNETTLLKRKISFSGYFLKLLAYQPGAAEPNSKPLVAPMFLGRFADIPQSPIVRDDGSNYWTTWGISILVIITALYFTFRVLTGILWKNKGPLASTDSDETPDLSWLETELTTASSSASQLSPPEPVKP